MLFLVTIHSICFLTISFIYIFLGTIYILERDEWIFISSFLFKSMSIDQWFTNWKENMESNLNVMYAWESFFPMPSLCFHAGDLWSFSYPMWGEEATPYILWSLMVCYLFPAILSFSSQLRKLHLNQACTKASVGWVPGLEGLTAGSVLVSGNQTN